MTTITNKTTKPLVIPLPGGKKLHLGPLKSGEISPKAADHPPVKKLVEAGQVEIVETHSKHRRETGGGPSAPRSTGGSGHAAGVRPSGDR